MEQRLTSSVRVGTSILTSMVCGGTSSVESHQEFPCCVACAVLAYLQASVFRLSILVWLSSVLNAKITILSQFAVVPGMLFAITWNKVIVSCYTTYMKVF